MKFKFNRKISERLSAEQVLHSVFFDEDSDVSDGDSSDDGADRVYAYSGQQHYDPAEVLALNSGVVSRQKVDTISPDLNCEATSCDSTDIEGHHFESGKLELLL